MLCPSAAQTRDVIGASIQSTELIDLFESNAVAFILVIAGGETEDFKNIFVWLAGS